MRRHAIGVVVVALWVAAVFVAGELVPAAVAWVLA